MSKLFQRVVFILSLSIFTALCLGFFLGGTALFGVHAGQQDGAYRQMGVYAEVLKKIQTDYVTVPSINDVTAGALHGLLESLDADSSYLDPTEYKIYKEKPVAGAAQVGIHVSKRFGYATVVSVMGGSPASQAHIADGDVIESIDGQSTRELSLAVIRLMLEGKPGTTVELSVIHPYKADPDKLQLTRAGIAPATLEEKQLENGTILYLKAGDLSAARVDEIAGSIRSAGAGHKILLDLRDSYGDDEQQGLRLANFFIQQGTLATLEGQKYPKQTFNADPARYLTGAPLAVLINSGTYGAAELAAADIVDLKRGDVIGEHSFGEGSVQKTIDLPEGAALLLTVAKYSSPAGIKIQDKAVTPTVEVEQPNEEEHPTHPPKTDETLDKAVELLKAKNG